MKKNLIAFLFGESQVDDEIAGIVESIADLDAEGAEDLKVEKQPLAKALSSLGIDAGELENDPRGLSLVFGNAEEYRAAHAILNEPDSLHKLAHLGWVSAPQGDVAMANEPAELRIRFLEIDNVEPADAKASYSDSDKARLNKVKDIIKKGREFSTEEPDFDDDNNPVDHDDPKKGKRDKGVGDAKDGSDPEGKPKGSEGNPSAGSSGSAPGKGDLTQPKEGDNAKLVKQEGIDWGKRLKALRARRGEPVGEGRGSKEHCKHCGSTAHTTANCPTGFAGRTKGKEKPLKENGILHAQGCECDDCKSDPIGMSTAASRQGGHRPWEEQIARAEAAVRPEVDRIHKPHDQTAALLKAHGLGEAGHKSGCQCGFCKNKGNIGLLRKGKGEKPEKKEGEVEESTAEQIVNSMLEGNPGTPPGILGTKSFSSMKVPGGSKDRKFRPAKGMVQAAPENSVVAAQTKPNRSA